MPNTVMAMRRNEEALDVLARPGGHVVGIVGVGVAAPEHDGADGEHRGDGESHGSVGEQAEQVPGGHGDDHLERQRRGRTGPHRQRAMEPGRHHDRGDHRLVGQFGEEHGGERCRHGRWVHRASSQP